MENVYIDLGDALTIGDGSSMVIGEDNLYTESESMVGPQGPPGPPGPAGFSPVATVTQNAGSATISITDATSTSSATIYDGQDGTDGAAASITVGSTTTGEPGTQASVSNSGTSSAAVLDFVIPKGVKGDQGEQGDAATVDVGTIITIAPDATPQVTNSGTVHDAVLNFAIPQGYDGFSPVATVTQNTGSATISITDENGTTTATVYDGATGATGPAGPQGPTGPAGQGFVDYSTSEVDTGIKWIDGKTIYRKVISTSTYTASSGYYPLGVTVDTFINVYGFVQRKDYKDIWQPIPSRIGNSGMYVQFQGLHRSSGVQIDWGTAWATNLNKIIIVVEYTK